MARVLLSTLMLSCAIGCSSSSGERPADAGASAEGSAEGSIGSSQVGRDGAASGEGGRTFQVDEGGTAGEGGNASQVGVGGSVHEGGNASPVGVGGTVGERAGSQGSAIGGAGSGGDKTVMGQGGTLQGTGGRSEGAGGSISHAEGGTVASDGGAGTAGGGLGGTIGDLGQGGSSSQTLPEGGVAGSANDGGADATEEGGSDSGGDGSSNPDPVACAGHAGPTFEQFFDNRKLATIRITLDQSGYEGTKWLDAMWSTWKHCPPFDNYVPARVQYESPDGAGNAICDSVGMRLRGSWPKGMWAIAGFKLDMQALDSPSASEKRRFADLNRINILSIEQDPAHMLQCLTYKVFRDFGLAAPFCNHLNVYVNGAYYGLLENVEQINKGFLRRHFGASNGNLYAASPSQGDCDGADDFEDSLARLEYSGPSFSSYSSQYQLTKATASDAEQTLIPMLKCGDTTETPSDADFRSCISEWIDVEEWLKEIAAESLTPAVEAWVGFYRNYYLYFKPDQQAPHNGRFIVWSWDQDTAFQKQKCTPANCDPATAVARSYASKNGSRAKLITRLTTVFRTEYCEAMRSFLDVYKPEIVDEMASVIESGIQNDKTVTVQSWQTSVSSIRSHVTNRRTSITTQIASLCP